jgi:hypothetical protein
MYRYRYRYIFAATCSNHGCHRAYGRSAAAAPGGSFTSTCGCYCPPEYGFSGDTCTTCNLACDGSTKAVAQVLSGASIACVHVSGEHRASGPGRTSLSTYVAWTRVCACRANACSRADHRAKKEQMHAPAGVNRRGSHALSSCGPWRGASSQSDIGPSTYVCFRKLWVVECSLPTRCVAFRPCASARVPRGSGHHPTLQAKPALPQSRRSCIRR